MSAADILSNLPDEIIHQILNAGDLDLKSLARTSVLSKRWCHLWKSSLTELHFRNIPLKVAEWNSFSQFVGKILSFRNDAEYRADLGALSLTTDGRLRPHMLQLLEKIFVHGVENGVRTFRLAVSSGWHFKPDPSDLSGLPGLSALLGSVENLELSFRGDVAKLLGPNTNFSGLKKLRLSRCVLALSTETAPGVFQVNSVSPYAPFEEMPNLNSLVLIETELRAIDGPVKISCSKLVDLVMVFPRDPEDFFVLPAMIICAPQVKTFTCKEMRMRMIRSVELPSLECLDIDVFLDSGFSFWSDKEEESLEVFGFLRCFAGVKRVKLHPSTITGLIMVPGLLERQESPFQRMECAEFHNCGTLISNSGVFNALVNYFFNDCIHGTALFDRIVAQPTGASEDSSSPVVMVYKSDLA